MVALSSFGSAYDFFAVLGRTGRFHFDAKASESKLAARI